MTWTISIFYLFLCTTITGTILTLIWYLIGICLERAGFLNITYRLLKWVMIFWILPLTYVILDLWDTLGTRWGGDLLLETPVTYIISNVFCWVWMIGVIIVAVGYIKGLISLTRIRRSAISCDYPVKELFDQTVRLFAIDRKVEIMQSYHVSIPRVTGCFRPIVILPVQHYSKEELQVVLAHELTHIKHHDLWMKNIMMLIRAIHFLNPVAGWFCRRMDRWMEFACDYDVCRWQGGMKDYYNVILNMIEMDWRPIVLVSQLVEDRNQLEERMERVKMSMNKKVKSKTIAALLVTCVMGLSGVSVYAATAETAQVISNINEATEVEIEEPLDPELQEYEESVTDVGVIEIEGDTEVMSVQSTTSTISFNWTINKNTLVKTSTFYVSSGKKISVTVSNPSGASIRVGIIKPGGTKTYVSSTGDVAHSFSVSTSGSYRVYVQNMGNTQISVSGSYYVK